MPGNDLPLLVAAAREAGETARRFTGASARRWDKPGGAGPVTEADLAVNEVLAARLRDARPGYGWLSEESEDGAGRLDASRVFIVDPIDGTRSFIEGSRAWAHALAVAEGGVVRAAVIYLPMMDKLYAAAEGQGATLNGTPLRASARTELEGASVLGAKPAYEPRNWRVPVPGFRRAYRPSLAYRLACVAEGRFDSMLTLRPTWEWDVAAGDLILREAGAVTSNRRGGALRFNNPVPQVDGILAANPLLHAAMLDALA
ncbi:3'(2'),5'-bisphosphate nucleotidase CysQ [Roseovarius spongiae]|uniref:3'(2'),5'-bisphosphate nucleotidase CysQ n=1 Tax=Roseovarius spongiae TaxID=2320272 RepID=A0A3A8AX32_9RHOB|nr:3'(2'),5'-bisphosphate nucleotidase CysQ [Roseovarius spongiae]RKF16266.1 3'(2'),5'-bisphosphate nucleotidase CysQ [Roseovarius spongiae]